ncbi:hypothetical protein LMG7974_00266 [Campylobacter majalis]|uniref:Multidrug efflux SMR transporter n=1 Tax=Campylobacter majalis TaxID=2790656 RepID=A0ABN7K7L5_9BACT|nr:multidrug efflux SMR transporter [Campylobacter majalis]CAD7287378.1 hypothetical protein LMG7974_00266 [Campylobacter majalis]
MSKLNFAWLLVILGGVVEVFWVTGLKHADTLATYALTGVGVLFSFSAMIMACKNLEVSVVYAVFVGIGASGVVLNEMILFGEPFSVIKVSLIALLMLSVIGLKFSSKQNDEKIVKNISKDLGLDELQDEIIQGAK